MKERLDQLMLQDFIELSCGNPKVLLEKHEVPNEEKMLRLAAKLMHDYKTIASPNKAKIDLIDAEDETKLQMKEKCASILVMLCEMKHPEMTKEILEELGIDTSQFDTDEKIAERCRAFLNEAKYDLERFRERQEEKKEGKPKSDAERIRDSWNKEIAYVMATLRMSIDPATTNTAIYANLVHQAEVRAKQMAKMPSMFPF
jgi:hypothetical protein